MNLTDELKSRLLPTDYANAQRELNCLDTLATRIKCLLENGQVEDAYQWLDATENSIKAIFDMTKRKEEADVILTTEQWIKRNNYLFGRS
jgi:ribosomal protein L22